MAIANARGRWTKAANDGYKSNITEEVPTC